MVMGRLKLKRKPGGTVGPMPTEPQLWCDLMLEKRPSDQWLADHQTQVNEGTAPEPTDEDMVLGINIYGHLAKPSSILPPKLWKQGKQLIGTLHEIPYVDFRKACEEDIAAQLAVAPGNHKVELAEIGRVALAMKAGKP